jgi:TRAP-type mannitol/chloroaromatic compound transport system permease large subunit
VLTIVYAVTAQISIGQMLIAGIVPGILLASLYIGYIVVMGWLKPEWVPIDRSMRSASWGEKLLSLRTLVFPILLIVLILGSIFFGIATDRISRSGRGRRLAACAFSSAASI